MQRPGLLGRSAKRDVHTCAATKLVSRAAHVYLAGNVCLPTSNHNANFPLTFSENTAYGTCLAGYQGSPTLLCLASGQWDSTVTSPCVRRQCPSETGPGNARWVPTDSTSTGYGTCLPGYSGSPNRICSIDAQWESVNSPCERTQSHLFLILRFSLPSIISVFSYFPAHGYFQLSFVLHPLVLMLAGISLVRDSLRTEPASSRVRASRPANVSLPGIGPRPRLIDVSGAAWKKSPSARNSPQPWKENTALEPATVILRCLPMARQRELVILLASGAPSSISVIIS